MEINANYSQAQDIISAQAKAEQTEALYQVKLMKMMQESEQIVGDVLEDTAEISKEAMNRYLAEVQK